MKKVLLIAIAAISVSLTSCKITAPEGPKFKQECYLMDYQAASQGGKVFLSESNSVNFDYTPIGSLLVEESSGIVAKKDVIMKEKENDAVYEESKPQKKTVYSVRESSSSSALNYAAKCCLEMGGDAIINLKVGKYYGSSTIYITGMVIKRR